MLCEHPEIAPILYRRTMVVGSTFLATSCMLLPVAAWSPTLQRMWSTPSIPSRHPDPSSRLVHGNRQRDPTDTHTASAASSTILAPIVAAIITFASPTSIPVAAAPPVAIRLKPEVCLAAL